MSNTKDYERDETGRIVKVGKWPFDLDRAVTFRKLRYPDAMYRRYVLEEARKSAESSGHEYTAQCYGDLLEAL